MTPASARVLNLLTESGALRTGHFQLSSGLHSDRYCQCASLFEQPRMGEEVARLMAALLPAELAPDVVLAPALGGILWGYELARALGVRSIFAERPTGAVGERAAFALRRGFALHAGERVLLAEDVVTTGGSVGELAPLVRGAGAEIVGFAAIVDRSGGRFRPDRPFFSLVELSFTTWEPDRCPLCARGEPVIKPGSRPEPGTR